MTQTIGRFLASEKRRYRARYLKVLGPVYVEYPGWRRHDRPEGHIPGGDHAFQVGPYLVSRPYGFGIDGMRALVEFCERHELECVIDGASSWHPGTTAIKIYRPEWAEEFSDRADSYGDAFRASVKKRVYLDIHGQTDRVYEPWARYESGVFVLNTTVTKHGVGIGKPVAVSDLLDPRVGVRIGAG